MHPKDRIDHASNTSARLFLNDNGAGSPQTAASGFNIGMDTT